MLWKFTLRKNCPYSELFWSTFFPHFPSFRLTMERYSVFGVILVHIFPAFSRIRTEHGEIRSISPHLARMRENAGKIRTRITPNKDTFYAVS